MSIAQFYGGPADGARVDITLWVGGSYFCLPELKEYDSEMVEATMRLCELHNGSIDIHILDAHEDEILPVFHWLYRVNINNKRLEFVSIVVHSGKGDEEANDG